MIARRRQPAPAACSGGGGDATAVMLSGVGKRYERVRALDDVSLSLERSRFLVLLGPSGSGKSTLVRCLAGIERPSEGEIAIDGRLVCDARRHVPPERRDLAMVFQDFALWPHMSVAENVAFPLRRRGVAGAETQRRADAMLDRVGLAVFAGRYPHELSGGEQQRVALARALVARPTLLLFDEPLSSLDANLRERLRIEIGTLVREHGATAVYITHDQSEAFALGDEIGVLQDGRLVQRGTPESIYTTPATPFVARFTGLSGVLGGRLLGAAQEAADLVSVLVPTTDVARGAQLAARPMDALHPGSAVQVMLRPTAVRLCAADAAEAAWRGVVRDGAYHGRGYDYVVELGAKLTLSGIFDDRRFAVGHTVGVTIDPRQALAFAADAAVSLPAPAADALPGAAPRSPTDVLDEIERRGDPLRRPR